MLQVPKIMFRNNKYKFIQIAWEIFKRKNRVPVKVYNQLLHLDQTWEQQLVIIILNLLEEEFSQEDFLYYYKEQVLSIRRSSNQIMIDILCIKFPKNSNPRKIYSNFQVIFSFNSIKVDKILKEKKLLK